MSDLPHDISGSIPGNHQYAIRLTRHIAEYVCKAVASLESAADKNHPAPLRGGHLRAGDSYLDAIIRYANAAKKELRIAYYVEKGE